MSCTLKLVILYDARNNVYTVCGHNLTPEEAKKTIAEYREKLLHALSVDQRARHRNPNLDDCKACRRDVARASGLEPKSKFQRRNTE
jgi:ribosomal protein L29